MKAIRIHFTDNGDELRIEEVPQPDPKADEVLICLPDGGAETGRDSAHSCRREWSWHGRNPDRQGPGGPSSHQCRL